MKQETETPTPIDHVLKPAKTLEILGISRTTGWRLQRAGKLPPAVVIDGRVIGYRQSDVMKWLDEHTVAAGE